MENWVASIFPGLLDGLNLSCGFPDGYTWLIENYDCALLVYVYQDPAWLALQSGLTLAQIQAKKTAINGHIDYRACQSWFGAFANVDAPGGFIAQRITNASTGAYGPAGTTPTNNCALPLSLVYDPVSNPNGVRCSTTDLAPTVWGTTITNGHRRANRIYDSEGVQYGLKALLSGAITPEDFVTLNEKIGGFDSDHVRGSARSVADTFALETGYRAGIFSNGKNLAKVPIIWSRVFDEFSVHTVWRAYAEKARLTRDAGSDANFVLWREGAIDNCCGQLLPARFPPESLMVISEWLDAPLA